MLNINIIGDFFFKIFAKNRQIRVRRGLTVSHSICHTMSAPAAPEFGDFWQIFSKKNPNNINIKPIIGPPIIPKSEVQAAKRRRVFLVTWRGNLAARLLLSDPRDC